jgi:hypothetical protein
MPKMTRTDVEARLASGNRNLCGFDLSHLDLSGLDLSHCNLQAAYLADSNLSGAKLDYADLSVANLRRADLTRASLQYTDCTEADFLDVNLRNAKLNGANLRSAYLDGITMNWNSHFLISARLAHAAMTLKERLLTADIQDDQNRCWAHWLNTTAEIYSLLGQEVGWWALFQMATWIVPQDAHAPDAVKLARQVMSQAAARRMGIPEGDELEIANEEDDDPTEEIVIPVPSESPAPAMADYPFALGVGNA